MSTKNPHISKVKLKVLEIEETPNVEPVETVNVELAKGDIAGTVTNQEGQVITIYYGEMTYQRPGKDKVHSIDFVQANFVGGATSEHGNILLSISLTDGNTFEGPLVTSVPTDPSTVPSDCMSVEQTADNQVTITFIEPEQGQFVAYPALYFHTTQGIIDPGVSVLRKPIEL